MRDTQFYENFKLQTEQVWHRCQLQQHIYGFQIQPGTRWNPGLNDSEIEKYENVVHAKFPNEFHDFLRCMNGTDLPTINIYGNDGTPHTNRPGIYSHPHDLALVLECIEYVKEFRDELHKDLSSQGFNLPNSASLVPIYGHRYIVCSDDPDECTVLSITRGDSIVYGINLQEYLLREFLPRSSPALS